MLPNAEIKYRRGLDLKKIIPQAMERDFTDILVINEDRKEPSILFYAFCTISTLLFIHSYSVTAMGLELKKTNRY